LQPSTSLAERRERAALSLSIGSYMSFSGSCTALQGLQWVALSC
jgi:hypothetical protein